MITACKVVQLHQRENQFLCNMHRLNFSNNNNSNNQQKKLLNLKINSNLKFKLQQKKLVNLKN